MKSECGAHIQSSVLQAQQQQRHFIPSGNYGMAELAARGLPPSPETGFTSSTPAFLLQRRESIRDGDSHRTDDDGNNSTTL